MFSMFTKRSASNLKNATIEELFQELRERGFNLIVDEKSLNITPTTRSTSVSAEVFAVLKAIDEYSEISRHRHDRDRTLTQYWTYFQAHDLERKPPGHCIDADKSLAVGITEYNKYEDPEQSQVLVIQHYDTERPGNFISKNDYKPVWAIALSVQEFEDLYSRTRDALLTGDTLIHREPSGPVVENEPWWQETHWALEDGNITGLRLRIKCTQDKIAREQLVRFSTKGNTFNLIEIVDVPTAEADLGEISVTLPQSAADIIPNTSYLSETFPIQTYDPEGDSKLEIRVSSGEPNVFHYEEGAHLCHSISSAVITVTNPTDARISIKEYWVDIERGTEWIRCPSVVGQMYERYGSPEVVYSNTVQSFDIANHSSLDLVLKGTIKNPLEGHAAYNGPYSSRIHHSVSQPLRARLHLKDDNDCVKTLQFEHSNRPMTDIWTSYPDAVANCAASDGFGEQYEPDMWLCVENPLTLNKCVICITHEPPADSATGSEDKQFIVRVFNDSRKVGGSCSYASTQTFKDLAYQHKGESEIDVELGGNENCTLTGLIDKESGIMYCLHGQVRVVDKNDEVLAFSESFMRL